MYICGANGSRPSVKSQSCLGNHWQHPALKLPYQLVSLFSQRKRQDCVRQNSCQVRQEPLVDGEKALCADRLSQAVENALVEIAVLVVEARHDGIYR